MNDHKTVVCIEDDPDMINLIRFVLRTKSINLIGAIGGKVGLETVRRVKPDLLLLDLMMPEVHGWDVLQEIRQDHELKDLPVIIVTVKSQVEDKVLGTHVFGAKDYVVKPFKVQNLLSSVCSALGVAA